MILAEISRARFNLIDGHDRLARPRRDRYKFLWAYFVDPRHHARFLTSIRVYDAYVSYWDENIELLEGSCPTISSSTERVKDAMDIRFLNDRDEGFFAVRRGSRNSGN